MNYLYYLVHALFAFWIVGTMAIVVGYMVMHFVEYGKAKARLKADRCWYV